MSYESNGGPEPDSAEGPERRRLMAMGASTVAAIAGPLSMSGVADHGGNHVQVSSLEDLKDYASRNGNHVRLNPGVYDLTNFIDGTSGSYIDFSGNNNTFDLTGVVFEDPTNPSAMSSPPAGDSQFVVSGSGNRLEGLEMIQHIIDYNKLLEVTGESNIIDNVTLRPQSSFPYGYGDYLGKGGTVLVDGLNKTSGLRIAGNHTRVLDTRIIHGAFGHGFFIQNDPADVYLENCYVRGDLRTSDAMLEETSGPAYANDFETAFHMGRHGGTIHPGYMKSLSEDGYRVYGAQDVTCVDCVAVGMRAGFEMNQSNPTLRNCTTVCCERGIWVESNATVTNCRADAKYGPALYLEGSNSTVEMEIAPATSDRNVYGLMTVTGSGHDVTLESWHDVERSDTVPLKVGFGEPEGGDVSNVFLPGSLDASTITNKTANVVDVYPNTTNTTINTESSVNNLGGSITVNRI